MQVFYVILFRPESVSCEAIRIVTELPDVIEDLEFLAGKTLWAKDHDDDEDQARLRDICERLLEDHIPIADDETVEGVDVQGRMLIFTISE